MKASRCIKEAADVLREAQASIQLRYLQTLHSIADQQNHTIIFSLPLSLFSGFQEGVAKLLGARPVMHSGGKPLITIEESQTSTMF
ncbi:hypothetical protein DPMN_148707 [Dreissena polymorpha]|uniref:Uncharacterized protein n=2 Tax=Dreissena polymorpha TaxID=45954 RepID=A0A9D4FA37_DREPO|nr:hypothetical protein DPMN_148707 [Dreissena polymorpha]